MEGAEYLLQQDAADTEISDKSLYSFAYLRTIVAQGWSRFQADRHPSSIRDPYY